VYPHHRQLSPRVRVILIEHADDPALIQLAD
jgi:hypothetical protein